jgi:hypothetical protein
MSAAAKAIDQRPRATAALHARTAILYVLVALLMSIAVHQSLIARLWVDDGARVGVPMASPRTDVSDNYVYFGLIKRGLGACNQTVDETAKDGGGNPLACTYLAGVLTGSVLYGTGLAVLGSPRLAIAALMILQTAAFTAALLFAFHVMMRRALTLPGAALLSITALLLVENFALSFYTGAPFLDFETLWRGEPSVTSLLNPPIFWAWGLAALGAIVLCLEADSWFRTIMAGLITAITASISIALGATLLGALSSAFVLLLLRRTIDRRLLVLVAACLVGLAWSYLQFRTYWASELGAQLGHGLLSTFRFNPAFLLLFIPAALGRIGVVGGAAQLVLRLTLFGSAMLGAVCESVELGSRLWLRGASVLAFVCCLAWLWRLGRDLSAWLIEHRGSRPTWLDATETPIIKGPAFVLIVVAAFSVMLHLRPLGTTSTGLIERDKYSVLEWLADRTQAGDVIASSNLEDSFLVDFYTPASPFPPLYAMTAVPWTEPLTRYFFVLGLIEDGDERLRAIRTASKSDFDEYARFSAAPITAPYDYAAAQVEVFYDYLVYRSYNRAAHVLEQDGDLSAEFLELVERLLGDARERSYEIDFLILRGDEQLNDLASLVEVYRNSSFTVFAPGDAGSVGAGDRVEPQH